MRRRKQKNGFKKAILIGIAFILVFAFYKYQQYNHLIETPVDAEETESITFTIDKGETVQSIADDLEEQGLILNKDAFKIYGRLTGLDRQVKSGRFPLSASLNTKEIFAVIISDQQRQAVITIPEGSTIIEIDQILSESDLIQAGEFINATKTFDLYANYSFLDESEQEQLPHPLEGYLFPDTYFVNPNNFSSDNFITVLLNTFMSKALPVIEQSERPLQEVVIVASMIEEEANRDKDRPIIGGIIWKRLDENWFLGIDATLLYLKDGREITYQDLQSDSAYNTRNKMGLTPGPITNPGLASIKASAFPQDSEYYYYLTSRDGDMIYASTNQEHTNNKAKYL